MCDLCTVKHLLALPCSSTQMARAHIWPAGQPVQSSEVMATGTRSICNILTQVPYVQVWVFGSQGCHSLFTVWFSTSLNAPPLPMRELQIL